MAAYRASEETTCFLGRNELDGWTVVLERYQRQYQREGPAMGRLSFPRLRGVLLGNKAAFVTGRWPFDNASGKSTGRLFTLVFGRTEEKAGGSSVTTR